MKKVVLAALLASATLTVNAQNSAVSKASKFVQSGDLEQAKTFIDQAIVNEKTRDKPKTWFTKGEVYQAIALVDSTNVNTVSLKEAVAAYNKAKEMSKEGSTYDFFSSNKIEELWGNFVNKGAQAYENNDYETALKGFENSTLVKPADTTGYLYGGISAQQAENYEVALKNFYSLLDLQYSDKESIFSTVIYIERNVNEDNDKALEAIRMARKEFPDNKDFAKEEINVLIASDKSEEALKQLDAAITAEPNNPNLYYSRAYLKDEIKDTDGAFADYKSAIAIDPEYFDANFNIAVLYYNKAAAYLKEANEMDLKTYQKEGEAVEGKARGEFKNALPYLEKCAELKPDDQTTLQTLQTVYTQLRMNDKAAAIESKMKDLGYL
ncbi:tetratricopeptide repeat protein [Xanthovirga aplysinae]|uniref:tetratricopeptide repeat protein n=1 Tax=Xanthovirga aplysinae TaxID=2529853 RepID=UPI0012BCEC1D|nr:tetratricopeptide repeat protein [Xanthovirga aplysinae]MTI32295.1 tetratricopeptide repeat protein [Xanthovirga aplysinae]